MSELGRVGLALVAAGTLGVASLPIFLQACKWADWELIPGHCQRRVLWWRRTAPVLILFSAGLIAVGLLAGLAGHLVPG
jgi:hypothetical protein